MLHDSVCLDICRQCGMPRSVLYILENIPNGQEDRGGQSEGGLKQRVSCVQHTIFAIGVLYATFVSFS